MAIKPKSEETVSETAVAEEKEIFAGSTADLPVAKTAQPPVVATNLLSEDEMEDLEFGFGTFPIITLNGSFECSDDSIEVEDGFECVIQSYKARYIFRVSDDTFFYTYDNPKRSSAGDSSRVTTSGEPYDDILAEWKEDGEKYEIKKYLEVVAQLKGVNEGKIALLSISPTSVGRFSGYVAMELGTLKGLHYSKVITKVDVGAKIKSKYSFNPWKFEFVSEL